VQRSAVSSQLPLKQGFGVVQGRAAPAHEPAAHLSPTVQYKPSSQLAVLFA
jgi:hypothetical protein